MSSLVQMGLRELLCAGYRGGILGPFGLLHSPVAGEISLEPVNKLEFGRHWCETSRPSTILTVLFRVRLRTVHLVSFVEKHHWARRQTLKVAGLYLLIKLCFSSLVQFIHRGARLIIRFQASCMLLPTYSRRQCCCGG